MIPKMQAVGIKDGIKFSYGGDIASTLDSHRLVEYVRQKYGIEKQNDLMEELFKCYFELEKNIGSNQVLEEALVNCGISDPIKDFLNSDQLKNEVLQLIHKYQYQRSISGVPHFIINDNFQLSGAQEKEVFLDLFEEITSR